MRVWHIEDGRLVEGSASDGTGSRGRIEALDERELDMEGAGHVLREAVAQMPHAYVPFIEFAPGMAAGVIALPADASNGAPPVNVGVVLEPTRLRLIGQMEACSEALTFLVRERVPMAGAAGALCGVMRYAVRDHPVLLSAVRRDFEVLEERLLEGHRRVDRGKMMADARRLMGFDALYQGMSDIASELSEGSDELVAQGDRLRFHSLARMLDRLSTRLESLQDYSLQLNGLYQEEIDIRQNSVMQWLTVIATIFMPLTFITGWYGMNFPTMAMLQEPWGYPLVVGVCLVIAVAEIVCFHRRGWLHFGGRRRPHPSRHGSARRKTK
ncbi:hypothetical protein H6A29_10030 [Collinsella tanakaei]|nr:hypothetical protein [Collinsella tanakaei]